MTFRNPVLLAGLAAAVLPLVLHLLARAKARAVPWGAMLLTDGPAVRRSAGRRLRYPLLLLLRCTAIAVLTVAVARPARTVDAGGEPSAVVLVVDGSPSMLHPDGNTTRFELARRVALARLARLRPGDQAGLIELGAAADVLPTTDLQTVASQLASLAPGPGTADQAEGLQRARDLLTAAGIDGGEIDLIGDRQKSAWAALTAGPHAGPAVVAVAVGAASSQNVVVESMTLRNPPAVAEQPALFSVVVRNDGDLPQGDLPLRWSGSNLTAVSSRVAVAAGGRTTVTRAVTFDRPGPGVVSASVAGAGLPGEPTARLAIDVVNVPRVRVLWRPPTTRPATTRSASAPATAPAASAKLPGPPAWLLGGGFDVDVAAAAPPAVAGPAVLVVSDTAPDGATVAALETFVAAGGNLLLAAGPRLPPGAWNARLSRAGFGLAPAAGDVVPAEGFPAPRVALPAAAPLAVDWAAVAVRRRLRLLPTRSETVLMECDGEPLVVARPYGRGQVIAVGVPLDAAWSARPRPDTYAGLAESLLRRLTAPTNERNLDLDAPLEMTVPWMRDRAAWITRPDLRTDRVPLLPTGWASLLHYTHTDRPGQYHVRIADHPAVDWVVRPDPAESNIAPLTDAQLDAILTPAGITRRSGDLPPPRFALDATAILIGGMALLLAAELALGGSFLPRPATAPAGAGQ